MKLRCLKDNFGDWIILWKNPETNRERIIEAFTTFNQAKSKIWHVLKCEECQDSLRETNELKSN